MSYRVPLAAGSTPGSVLPGTGLTVTDGVLNVVPVALLDQAYFFSTATQTNPVGGNANIVTFNNAAVNVGITLVGGTQITVSKTANYNLQFTAQVDKTDAGEDLVDFWIVRSGVNYPDTNSESVVSGTIGVLAVSFSYTVALLAGQNIQIAWQSIDTSMRLLTVPIQAAPVRPATPSVRCTIVQL